MTEREKMDKGLVYDPADTDIMNEQTRALKKLKNYNKISPANFSKMCRQAKKTFGKIGNGSVVIPPVYANWGGKHVYIGDYFYGNFGATFVDDGNIFIGDHVMFGPHVTVATAGHPVLPEPRSHGYQYNADVHIGNNVWVGSCAVILPGVTIGDNAVIGAGSIVTKDIPANVVAVGNPCKVLREINDHDKQYYFKDKKFTEEL